MKEEFFTAGSVPHDDPAVVRAMATIDELRPAEQRELLRSTLRAVLAYERTEDVDHLVNFAKNFLGTVRLHGVPAYVEAVRNAPKERRGSQGPQNISEVLNRLME